MAKKPKLPARTNKADVITTKELEPYCIKELGYNVNPTLQKELIVWNNAEKNLL